ncbi:TraY domain-containing protein [Aeromonas hydrophila]
MILFHLSSAGHFPIQTHRMHLIFSTAVLYGQPVITFPPPLRTYETHRFFSLLLAPMIICGKINSNLEFESNFTVIMMSGPYKDTSTVVQLSADLNKLLTEAASRSGRTKVQEASLRLRDHLMLFSDIATEGKRFSVDDKDN